MTFARYLVGDVHAVLATLEPASVDLVLTSPPFLALRSYLPAGHPDKQHEIGSEATPGAFIDVLLDVVEACERVLASHGSMCIELGDTYSGSGGAGGDYNPGGLRDGQEPFKQKWDRTSGRTSPINGAPYADTFKGGGPGGKGWPLDKSLCLIPELFRIALVYGINPLTGRQTRRWRARNVIRWCRPNPPVGALGDKYRPATTDMVVITRNRDRYFDLDAVRTITMDPKQTRLMGSALKESPTKGNTRDIGDTMTNNPAGAPPLDWWKISTEPYVGAHYATWPTKLLETPIDSMTPLRVCVTCGKPSERIVEHDRTFDKVGVSAGRSEARDPKAGPMGSVYEVTRETIGWSDCGHNSWRTGLVLDPFAGSGTTLAVATGHGRDAIGIDIDPRNAQLALDRVGPLLLTVEVLDRAA